MTLAVWCLVPSVTSVVGAQRVPGRDLWHFPLASMDRAAALPSEVADGLRNPAAIALPSGIRARVGAAALQTPSEQGVAQQLLAAAFGLHPRFTVGLTAAYASVTDLFYTDTDPQTSGRIPYNTLIVATTAAWRMSPRVAGGIAARYRTGKDGEDRTSTVGVDVGLLVERLTRFDGRIAVSSFLWRPAQAGEERPTIHVGADARFLGTTDREARVGYALATTRRAQREDFFYLAGRLTALAGTIGFVRSAGFGFDEWRSRLGLRLHYSDYAAGVAREQNGAGLDPIYQFTLSVAIR